MSNTTETPITEDNEVVESFTRLKELVAEIEVLIPKVIEKNKSAARNARNNLNSIKKLITPLRSSIQEIVKPSKAK